jgi:hypothetical protein
MPELLVSRADLRDRSMAEPAVHALAQDLIERTAAAQDLRTASLARPSIHCSPAAIRAADEANTMALRRYVNQHGWPSESAQGAEVAQAALMIALHSDRDPALQVRCRDLLAHAVRTGQDSAVRWAYLVDRCATNRAEPQVYGTRVEWRAGRVQPRPVADAEHLDTRRASVGLGPHDDYLRALTRQAQPPTASTSRS